MNNPHRPIGVFDSGVGGLTVLRALVHLLPHESFIYVGDTARVPYGSKSPEAVRRFSLEIARFFRRKGVKMMVTACNTASALALPDLRAFMPVPVIGVIEPGARAALASTSKPFDFARLSCTVPRTLSTGEQLAMLAKTKHHAPAAERNKDPILGVLRELCSETKFVLTIAEGSGQHVVHFARHLPHVTFQPTDAKLGAFARIGMRVLLCT